MVNSVTTRMLTAAEAGTSPLARARRSCEWRRSMTLARTLAVRPARNHRAMEPEARALDDPEAWLCHYTRAETAFAHILPSGKLRMNPYSKMRDPFENQRPVFLSAGAWGDDRDEQERLFWKLQGAVSRSRDRWALLSLTQGDHREFSRDVESLFRCPWSRPRMWEQYAENHAGACLIFDRAALREALHHDLGGKGQYSEGSVEYTPAGFAASEGAAVQLGDFHEATLKDDVAHHVVKHNRDFFFLKTEDWASEFEYRVVFRRESDVPLANIVAGHFAGYGRALRYVVVGERFPAWQLPGARAVADSAGVELRQMKWELARPWPAKIPAP
jgi:hypothetical protein